VLGTVHKERDEELGKSTGLPIQRSQD
jgi:hypothetical protein